MRLVTGWFGVDVAASTLDGVGFQGRGEGERMSCRTARSAGCWTYTPVSGQKGVPNASEGAATSSSPRPQVPGGNLEPTRYRITVRGQLTEQLMSAFQGLDVEPDIEQTSLVAEIRDQSHLYGVLDLVRELGLDLVSAETNWVTPEPGDEESAM